MQNSKDLTIDNIKLNVLVYGKSGSGKTPFASFFPNPYFFDFDNGMMSVRGRNVAYDTMASYAEFEVKFAEMERKCPFDTLVIDSITTLEKYCMNRALIANHRAMPTMNEWNVLIADLTELFTRATKIGKNVVFIAHEEMVQDEITGEIMVRPQIVGKKLPAQLPLWFSEVYRTQVSRSKEGVPVYSILTVADMKYTAKSRIHCLPAVLDWSKNGEMLNSYELILEKMRGGATSGTGTVK